jgi:hypothetical protein
MFPDYVDAKFVDYPFESSTSLIDQFKDTFGQTPKENYQHWSESCSYKYAAAPDGWASAWSRPWIAFRSGSILFDNSDYIQYATLDAKPFENMIPVQKDCSDCVKWVVYLENHPDFALQLSNESRILGAKIDEDQIKSYWKKIIHYMIAKHTYLAL